MSKKWSSARLGSKAPASSFWLTSWPEHTMCKVDMDRKEGLGRCAAYGKEPAQSTSIFSAYLRGHQRRRCRPVTTIISSLSSERSRRFNLGTRWRRWAACWYWRSRWPQRTILAPTGARASLSCPCTGDDKNLPLAVGTTTAATHASPSSSQKPRCTGTTRD